MRSFNYQNFTKTKVGTNIAQTGSERVTKFINSNLHKNILVANEIKSAVSQVKTLFLTYGIAKFFKICKARFRYIFSLNSELF